MLPNNLLCHQCQCRVRSTARFCGQCGASLAGAQPGVAPALAQLIGSDGRYRLRRMIGKGGFGEAYLALDTRLNRLCVVKKLVVPPSANEPHLVHASFEREARLLVSLNSPGHPNIPEIYEYIPESQALVMKYIAGRSLAQLLNRRSDPFPEEQALRYARDVCAALTYMHSREPEPVLHRDIKPANILLGDDGRIWLIDFGLAKAAPGLPTAFDTQATQLAGTLGYSAPEQWRGAAEPRSDVYALAATLYMLLTNYQPSRAQLLAQMHGNASSLPSLRQINPAARPQVQQLIERAMAAEPARRPSAAEMLAELDRLLSRPNIPDPTEPAQPPELAALIGRDAELAAYEQRLQEEHIVIVTGLPGVGKTALAAALARRFGDPGRVFWHTFHQGEGIDSLIWDLASFLAWNGQDELWQMLQHTRLTGGQPPPPEALCDYLVNLLRGQGYLLCLDDFQFVIDEPILDILIRRLTPEVRAGSLSLLLTSRSTPNFAQAASLPLAGLSPEGTGALLASRGITLAQGLLDTLTSRTGGNAQLLFLSINALQGAKDPTQVIAKLTDVADIERYLLEEVDTGLRDDERALMEALAVLLGYPATADAIDAVIETRSSVRRILSSLTSRNLLIVMESEAGRSYVQHAIVQQFYYESIGKRTRALMHHRAASYFAQDAPDALQAARHYQLAGEWAPAADLATSHTWELINMGQARALRMLLGQFEQRWLDDSRWIDVLAAGGQLDAVFGDHAQARNKYQDALVRLGTMPDNTTQRERYARICRSIGETLEYERPQEALQWLQRGLQHMQGTNVLEEAAIQIKTGTVLFALGSYDAALVALESGQALLPDGPSQLRISALHTLGSIHSVQGAIARGMAYTEHGIALCRELHDQVRLAKMLSNLAIDKSIIGDLNGALADFQQALELSEQLGSDGQRYVLEVNIGTTYIKTGDYEAAYDHLQRALALARAANALFIEIAIQLSLADLFLRQSAAEPAATALAEAERITEDVGAPAQLPELYRGWSRLALLRGDTQGALGHARHALDLAQQQKLDLDVGIGWRVLGQAFLADGQREAAQDAFRQSLALLDGNDVYAADETRAVWEQGPGESEQYITVNRSHTE